VVAVDGLPVVEAVVEHLSGMPPSPGGMRRRSASRMCCLRGATGSGSGAGGALRGSSNVAMDRRWRRWRRVHAQAPPAVARYRVGLMASACEPGRQLTDRDRADPHGTMASMNR
jgi:hypothetical protein